MRLPLIAVALLALPLGIAAMGQTSDTAPDTPAPDEPIERPALPAPEGTMTLERVGEILARLDDKARIRQGGRVAEVTINETTVLFVSDPDQNRMRLMAPIKPASSLTEAELMRLSQANFDTALDARYAVARGVLWSVYIHPLSALHDRQFVEAVGQVVNAAESYGSTYSSGLLSFGGGDSRGLIQRQLIDRLLDDAQDI